MIMQRFFLVLLANVVLHTSSAAKVKKLLDIGQLDSLDLSVATKLLPLKVMKTLKPKSSNGKELVLAHKALEKILASNGQYYLPQIDADLQWYKAQSCFTETLTLIKTKSLSGRVASLSDVSSTAPSILTDVSIVDSRSTAPPTIDSRSTAPQSLSESLSDASMDPRSTAPSTIDVSIIDSRSTTPQSLAASFRPRTPPKRPPPPLSVRSQGTQTGSGGVRSQGTQTDERRYAKSLPATEQKSLKDAVEIVGLASGPADSLNFFLNASVKHINQYMEILYEQTKKKIKESRSSKRKNQMYTDEDDDWSSYIQPEKDFHKFIVAAAINFKCDATIRYNGYLSEKELRALEQLIEGTTYSLIPKLNGYLQTKRLPLGVNLQEEKMLQLAFKPALRNVPINISVAYNRLKAKLGKEHKEYSSSVAYADKLDLGRETLQEQAGKMLRHTIERSIKSTIAENLRLAGAVDLDQLTVQADIRVPVERRLTELADRLVRRINSSLKQEKETVKFVYEALVTNWITGLVAEPAAGQEKHLLYEKIEELVMARLAAEIADADLQKHEARIRVSGFEKSAAKNEFAAAHLSNIKKIRAEFAKFRVDFDKILANEKPSFKKGFHMRSPINQAISDL